MTKETGEIETRCPARDRGLDLRHFQKIETADTSPTLTSIARVAFGLNVGVAVLFNLIGALGDAKAQRRKPEIFSVFLRPCVFALESLLSGRRSRRWRPKDPGTSLGDASGTLERERGRQVSGRRAGALGGEGVRAIGTSAAAGRDGSGGGAFGRSALGLLALAAVAGRRAGLGGLGLRGLLVLAARLGGLVGEQGLVLDGLLEMGAEPRHPALVRLVLGRRRDGADIVLAVVLLHGARLAADLQELLQHRLMLPQRVDLGRLVEDALIRLGVDVGLVPVVRHRGGELGEHIREPLLLAARALEPAGWEVDQIVLERVEINQDGSGKSGSRDLRHVQPSSILTAGPGYLQIDRNRQGHSHNG